MDEYRPSYIDIKNTIALVALKIKEYYNIKYSPIFFKEGSLVSLKLYKRYNVPGIILKKIGP